MSRGLGFSAQLNIDGDCRKPYCISRFAAIHVFGSAVVLRHAGGRMTAKMQGIPGAGMGIPLCGKASNVFGR
jgi:hypothetical protein